MTDWNLFILTYLTAGVSLYALCYAVHAEGPKERLRWRVRQPAVAAVIIFGWGPVVMWIAAEAFGKWVGRWSR